MLNHRVQETNRCKVREGWVVLSKKMEIHSCTFKATIYIYIYII